MRIGVKGSRSAQRGRQRFGQVTIANADPGGAAFTNQAIDEAHRAVQELLVHEV